MKTKNNLPPQENARILILSLRHIRNLVYNYCLFEFEDLISEIDSVDLVVPPQYNLSSQVITKIAKGGARINKNFNYINPSFTSFKLEKEYDLFLVILEDARHFLPINFIKNWRNKCKKTVCYLVETWDGDLEKFKYYLPFFQDFDYIYSGTACITEQLANIIGRPCIYLPTGVDAIKFCPQKPFSERFIDVCSIGRRSTITHEALLNLAAEKEFFYSYDTFAVSGSKLIEPSHPQGHRRMMANLLKNSRYFIANYAKADLPDTIKTQQEIGYRFFEGAAAGAVMIGCPPNLQLFNQYFDWQDAVIPIPFDAPNIADIISELDAQSDRLAKISRDNIINSLLKHDWVYRWQDILTQVGLEPTSAMSSRQAYLQELAQAQSLNYPSASSIA
jgi:hypothetical protein